MDLWLFKLDQPRGFDAMRAETEDFTRIASHVRVTAAPGDRVVIYNIADQHLAAVLTVTGEAWKRTEGEDLERWPYAVSTRPEILSSRGPKWPVPAVTSAGSMRQSSPSSRPSSGSTAARARPLLHCARSNGPDNGQAVTG